MTREQWCLLNAVEKARRIAATFGWQYEPSDAVSSEIHVTPGLCYVLGHNKLSWMKLAFEVQTEIERRGLTDKFVQNLLTIVGELLGRNCESNYQLWRAITASADDRLLAAVTTIEQQREADDGST